MNLPLTNTLFLTLNSGDDRPETLRRDRAGFNT